MKLVVSEWGSGGPRALLLHGISSSAAGWWRVGPALAALGWTVAAPDLRGHGQSPAGDSYTLDDYRDDVLELGGWDLVLGHSLGGAIALSCIDAAPGFTERLILEDPALRAGPGPADEWLLAPFHRPLTPEQVAADHPRWHETDAAIKAEALAETSNEVVAATVEAGWDVREVMAGLTVPTLLLLADPSLGPLLSQADAGTYAAANPLIQYQTIVGGSHSMHRDAFEPFWAAVATFVASGAGATA